MQKSVMVKTASILHLLMKYFIFLPCTIRSTVAFSGVSMTLVILFTATQVYEDSSDFRVLEKNKVEVRLWMPSSSVMATLSASSSTTN